MRAAIPLGLLLLLGAAPDAAAPPPDPAALAGRIDAYLGELRQRELRSDQVTPWVVLHAVVAFHQGVTVLDAESGQRLEAVRWLLTRAKYDGLPIFDVAGGVPVVRPRGPGEPHFLVQDHDDQYLHLLAEVAAPPDRRLLAAGGREFTVQDLVAASQRGFRPDQELGWTLVALSTYTPGDVAWQAGDGRSWRTPDLLGLAIALDARRETEGGPHHLYGVAYALRRLRAPAGRGGRPDDPGDAQVLADAEVYLRRYAALARRFQRPDGAFSGSVFEMSSRPVTPNHLVHTTGHCLEWLAAALTPEELREPWVARAADRLLRELQAHPRDTFAEGALYHAAHGLSLYRAALK